MSTTYSALPSAAETLPTPERILEAAEHLLIERGFQGTSLRALTEAAGVNLAAVHYHFGSKEGLLEALFKRRVEPINRERLCRLTELEASGAFNLEDVLEAFLAPLVGRPVSERSVSPRLVGRLSGESPSLIKPMLQRAFGALGERFLAAIAQTVPEVPRDELAWRFHFTIGAMLHQATQERPLIGETADPHTALHRLVRFAAAGLRAKGASS